MLMMDFFFFFFLEREFAFCNFYFLLCFAMHLHGVQVISMMGIRAMDRMDKINGRVF